MGKLLQGERHPEKILGGKSSGLYSKEYTAIVERNMTPAYSPYLSLGGLSQYRVLPIQVLEDKKSCIFREMNKR